MYKISICPAFKTQTYCDCRINCQKKLKEAHMWLLLTRRSPHFNFSPLEGLLMKITWLRSHHRAIRLTVRKFLRTTSEIELIEKIGKGLIYYWNKVKVCDRKLLFLLSLTPDIPRILSMKDLRVRKELGLELTVSHFFWDSTVLALKE